MSVEIRHYRTPKKVRILRTPEFDEWFEEQTDKTKVIVDARLDRIKDEGYFGWVKKFDEITELKWKSGMRVYMRERRDEFVIVLVGGNKNAQQRDIERAKKIIKELE